MFTILLPTDFSDNAQRAIDYAIRLFEKEECTFCILHAYHDAPSGSKSKADLEIELKNLTESILQKEQNPKHHFKPVFVMDSIVNALNIAMTDNAIDYIFMGTKGASSLFNVFMGSNTVRVIRHLHTCPIVAIPSDYVFTAPEEIVLANNYKHRFSNEELLPLIQLAKLWDSKVLVTHIFSKKTLSKDQKQNKEELSLHLKEIRTNFIEAQMGVSVTSSLFTLKKENPQIGMAALLKSKHDFFDALLREPVLRKMAFNTELPLLVLPQLT
ncbi:universal stress protein [Maribacter sp. ANRC-HE7]|uniref:Universal stress protein n=1 Tax=Maribacter aquimaris TaxID=2737171 RepID=A0ABR7V0U6_9FLAO|nr:universal stress protein [Maribacter aquimaris]MBD0778439.1 universal stress protein [Maribacter aquimaris]